jgi:hypothetical protein
MESEALQSSGVRQDFLTTVLSVNKNSEMLARMNTDPAAKLLAEGTPEALRKLVRDPDLFTAGRDWYDVMTSGMAEEAAEDQFELFARSTVPSFDNLVQTAVYDDIAGRVFTKGGRIDTNKLFSALQDYGADRLAEVMPDKLRLLQIAGGAEEMLEAGGRVGLSRGAAGPDRARAVQELMQNAIAGPGSQISGGIVSRREMNATWLLVSTKMKKLMGWTDKSAVIEAFKSDEAAALVDLNLSSGQVFPLINSLSVRMGKGPLSREAYEDAVNSLARQIPKPVVREEVQNEESEEAEQ